MVWRALKGQDSISKEFITAAGGHFHWKVGKAISSLSNLLPAKQETSLLGSHSLIALSLVSSWSHDSCKWLCPLWMSVSTSDIILSFSRLHFTQMVSLILLLASLVKFVRTSPGFLLEVPDTALCSL